ncbi:HSPB1-associated protein 1 [Planococcus citri]|uniref:HSPB1-associated protein 1 n=1 Tax=Planococcus citri TaxID=170843 RepID=UPI0031F77772
MSHYDCYRELIEKSNAPIVFSKVIEWDFLTWDLEKWCSVFQEEVFPFRCGQRLCQKDPFWESSCTTEYHTMSEFLHFCSDQSAVKNKFWYFDYKHIAEFFKDNIKLFQNISWSKLGFPERKAEDSTIWIGSPGAHTPCHVDSYGFNIIAQVYGRKRWLLFPPSETDHLKPTRVPYEESSVYSSINFSCYRYSQDVEVNKCYVVDLNPGDVLFVPAKWWHYVENLSTAISINTWIPHENDNQWKLEEALVRYFVSSVVQDLPLEKRKIMLNPNELDIEDTSLILEILKYCENQCAVCTNEKIYQFSQEAHDDECHIHVYKFVPSISSADMMKIMKQISICDESEIANNEASSIAECDDGHLKSLINAFCHPSVIAEVRNKLMSDKMK